MQDGFLRIAIVARVVDNFGDAGVAWRLARQLVTEHGADVTLWIDAVGVLARFMPALDPACPDAIVANVRVRHLAAEAPPLHPWPEVVVQMFGCALPEAWLFAIEHSAAPPVWINLEYLSAEDWVEGAHGLPSPHPHRALKRWFFYPGFTARTGGLLRERDLPEPAAAERVQAWADVGLPPPPPDALAVSLFCYPTPSAYALLDAWSREARPVHALVPDGVAGEAVSAFLGAPLRPGDVHVRGSLVLAVVPFVDQPGFDRRLRACDFSVVRGEDSFVRAQWARAPVRVAHLSAGGRRAPRQARRVPRPLPRGSRRGTGRRARRVHARLQCRRRRVAAQRMARVARCAAGAARACGALGNRTVALSRPRHAACRVCSCQAIMMGFPNMRLSGRALPFP